VTDAPRLEVLEGDASAEKGRAWAMRSMGAAAVAVFTVGLPFLAVPLGLFAVVGGVRALSIRSERVPGARFWAWSGIAVGAATVAASLVWLPYLLE